MSWNDVAEAYDEVILQLTMNWTDEGERQNLIGLINVLGDEIEKMRPRKICKGCRLSTLLCICQRIDS